MLLGSFRERTDDARRAEDALLFIHDQKSAARMQREIDGLVALTDSLERYRLDLSATQIRASLDTLRAAARDEYEQASAGRSTVAEMISQQRTRRAIASVDSALGASATTLRNRTRQRFADATSETLRAERLVAGALPIALLIALVIGIWLLRSISRPVHELDRGMRAIAEGDLTHELGLSPTQGGEFGRLAASYRAMARQLGELERLRAEFVERRFPRAQDANQRDHRLPGAPPGGDLRRAEPQAEGDPPHDKQAGADADAAGQAPARHQSLRGKRRKDRSAAGGSAETADYSGELVLRARKSAGHRVLDRPRSGSPGKGLLG